MSLGPLMLDIDGVELSLEDREILSDPRVGGVILFSRNYHSPEQLSALCSEIHALRSPRLLIAVDHEGGRVQRFRHGFTELPAMAQIMRSSSSSNSSSNSLESARKNADTIGWLLAAELLVCGVDFSFTPVLDLSHGVSGVIGDRAFHRKPEVVSALAQSLMRGMHRAGMGAVGKHFPGHGWVKEDSHLEVPVDGRTFADILVDDLIPFERMVEYGMEGVMPAHIYYSKIDPDNPAGFSRFWLQEVLRRQLRFEGVIFSDDLSMEGAGKIGDYPTRAAAALDAGCDMVLVCNHREYAIQVLDSLPDAPNPLTTARLIRLHARGKLSHKDISLEDLMQSSEWQIADRVVNEMREVHTQEMEL
ncbi:MAG: beta-N-acetylhexosaminidase [Thiotrichales bacterium]|jgi:beta-N-acetylhexosaminidase|nr:beta-N-acetylhexosaminidase [Thiotrichales bacterium]MBT3614157.1 beta-N-acetylhexosaminidase [Thiotrichales bacterium]MBT3752592.1 beta-N-acetylhexosaminidase [Thiotrichales bacterium]MBT3838240.1 beta-N-acetylhexosaminidase [Thiotrichales bacterium]MBT4152520.1 beta-N-acetylhexosaminidase [Thiotrichales bacterium]